jgi:hypothetical protein
MNSVLVGSDSNGAKGTYATLGSSESDTPSRLRWFKMSGHIDHNHAGSFANSAVPANTCGLALIC